MVIDWVSLRKASSDVWFSVHWVQYSYVQEMSPRSTSSRCTVVWVIW